jgi:hypothetical protein
MCRRQHELGLQFFPAGLLHPARESRVIGIYLTRFVKLAAILTDKAEVVDPRGAVALRMAECRLEHCSFGSLWRRRATVPDAFPAAVSPTHGARWATADRGFARLECLKWCDPSKLRWRGGRLHNVVIVPLRRFWPGSNRHRPNAREHTWRKTDTDRWSAPYSTSAALRSQRAVASRGSSACRLVRPGLRLM